MFFFVVCTVLFFGGKAYTDTDVLIESCTHATYNIHTSRRATHRHGQHGDGHREMYVYGEGEKELRERWQMCRKGGVTKR